MGEGRKDGRRRSRRCHKDGSQRSTAEKNQDAANPRTPHALREERGREEEKEDTEEEDEQGAEGRERLAEENALAMTSRKKLKALGERERGGERGETKRERGQEGREAAREKHSRRARKGYKRSSAGREPTKSRRDHNRNERKTQASSENQEVREEQGNPRGRHRQ